MKGKDEIPLSYSLLTDTYSTEPLPHPLPLEYSPISLPLPIGAI